MRGLQSLLREAAITLTPFHRIPGGLVWDPHSYVFISCNVCLGVMQFDFRLLWFILLVSLSDDLVCAFLDVPLISFLLRAQFCSVDST